MDWSGIVNAAAGALGGAATAAYDYNAQQILQQRELMLAQLKANIDIQKSGAEQQQKSDIDAHNAQQDAATAATKAAATEKAQKEAAAAAPRTQQELAAETEKKREFELQQQRLEEDAKQRAADRKAQRENTAAIAAAGRSSAEDRAAERADAAKSAAKDKADAKAEADRQRQEASWKTVDSVSGTQSNEYLPGYTRKLVRASPAVPAEEPSLLNRVTGGKIGSAGAPAQPEVGAHWQYYKDGKPVEAPTLGGSKASAAATEGAPSPDKPSTAPLALDAWLQRARKIPANGAYSDQQLIDYYNKNYGK